MGEDGAETYNAGSEQDFVVEPANVAQQVCCCRFCGSETFLRFLQTHWNLASTYSGSAPSHSRIGPCRASTYSVLDLAALDLAEVPPSVSAPSHRPAVAYGAALLPSAQKPAWVDNETTGGKREGI